MIDQRTCCVCEKDFERKRSVHEHSVRRGGENYLPKCSKQCVAKASQSPDGLTVSLTCAQCGETFIRNRQDHLKNLRKSSGQSFCSISCSNSFNGRLKQEKYRAKRGGGLSETEKRALAKPQTPALYGVAKGELFSKRKNWQSARSAIQNNARKLYKTSDKPKVCAVCGYSLHYEVAHIKDVASFPDSTLISEINALDNLVALCSNHHWEHDNGHLKLVLTK